MISSVTELDSEKKNEKTIIAAISEIESYLLFSSKTDSLDFFDMFCEENYLKEYIRLLSLNNKEISLAILNSINILILNISNNQFLYYFFSSQIVNSIISSSFQEDEYITYQINFIKSLSLKITKDTLYFFLDKNKNKCPLIAKTLTLYNMNDPMVRNVVRTIILTMLRIEDVNLRNFLVSFPVNVYYVNVIFMLKEKILEIGKYNVNNENFEKFNSLHEDLIEILEYIQDIINIKIDSINYIITNALMCEIILPLCNVIISKKAEKISLTFAIYLIVLFIHMLKIDSLYNMITVVIFDDFIPENIMNNYIKSASFDSAFQTIIDNVDYMIKYNESVDKESSKWKNIKEYISFISGVNLEDSTVNKSNVYKEFVNFFNERKDDVSHSGYVKNEISENFKCLLNTKDDLFMLLMNLMFNIILRKKKEESIIVNNENCSLFNLIQKEKKKILIDNIFNLSSQEKEKINTSCYLLDTLIAMISTEQKLLNITTKIILENISLVIHIIHSENTPQSQSILKIQCQKIAELFFSTISFLNKSLNLDNSDKSLNYIEIKKYSYDLFYSAYEYFKNNILNQINEIITLPWLLIPRIFIEQISSIPQYMRSNKSNAEFFVSNSIVFLFIYNLLDEMNNEGKNQTTTFPLKSSEEVYDIEKEYEYESLPNECENCKLITEKEKIKCVLVLLSSDICIGRIIGKDFDSFTKVTIIHKIPFRHLIVKINEAVSSKVLLIGDDRWNFENFLHVDFFHKDTAKTISTIIDDHRGIAINLELSLIESFIENSISCVMEK